MTIHAAIMTMLALAGSAMAAGAVEPISELDAQRLPPAVVVDRTLGLLGEVATLVPDAQHLGPRLGYSLVTKPRPAGAGRFCRADWMKPDFDPPPGLDQDFDRKARVVGFSAGQVFTPANGRDCGSLVPFDGFFHAASESDATWGYLLLERAIAEAGKGRVPATCDRTLLPDGVKNCSDLLAAQKLGELRYVAPCRERYERKTAALCYAFSMRNISLQVAATGLRGAVVDVRIEPLPVA